MEKMGSKHVALELLFCKRHSITNDVFICLSYQLNIWTVWWGLNLKDSFPFSTTGFDLYIEIHWWPQTHTVHTHTWWKTNLWGYPQCRQPEINNSKFTPLNSRRLCLQLSVSIYPPPWKRGEVKKTNGRVNVTHPPPPPPIQITSTPSFFPQTARGFTHSIGQEIGDVTTSHAAEHYKALIAQTHTNVEFHAGMRTFIRDGPHSLLFLIPHSLSLCLRLTALMVSTQTPLDTYCGSSGNQNTIKVSIKNVRSLIVKSTL